MAKMTRQEIAELCATGTTEDAPDGLYWTGVANLYIQIRNGNATWLMRYNRRGRNHAMGLGSLKDVTYTKAQNDVLNWMAHVRAGRDPIAIRRAERAGLEASASAASADVPTFRQAARAFIGNASPNWKDEYSEIGWARRLRTYVYPVVGSLPVDRITVEHVADVLKPIWRERPPTALKLLNHMRRILDYAIAREWRTEANPAVWSDGGKLSILLGGRARHSTKHFRALDWPLAPAFWKALQQIDGQSAAALRLLTLTIVRPAVAAGADWAEFDMERAIWNVPAERMKRDRPHRVPLSDLALDVLRAQEPEDCGAVFPSRVGGPIKPTTLIRAIPEGFDTSAHGLRSTFTDWAREHATIDREIRELVLAHQEDSSTVRAYARSDLLEPRREAMQRWTDFLSGREDRS